MRAASPLSAARAVAQAAAQSAPAIATAALATATGFLVLLLSPVPMVRGFGLLLVAGIAVAFLCALTAGSAVLILGERDGGWLGASWRGAGEILGPIAGAGWAGPDGGSCPGRGPRATAPRRRGGSSPPWSRTPGGCWRWRRCSRSSAGSPTRRRRCSPT